MVHRANQEAWRRDKPLALARNWILIFWWAACSLVTIVIVISVAAVEAVSWSNSQPKL
jgi:hypothetical protein